MNISEFNIQYQRLAECFPNKFSAISKLETVQKYVLSMDAKWFEALVDRILMTTHGDIDIGEAVAAERRSKKSKQFADDTIKAMDATSRHITDQGFEKTLSRYGAKSLLEAIEKSRKGDL